MIFASESFADFKINITVNGRILPATLDDNPASRAIYESLPLYLNMKNIYGREMSITFPFKLPTGKLIGSNYRIGDIIYWPNKHSLAILYKQNNQRFQRQHIGHIDNGTEVFEGLKEAEVILTVRNE